MVPLLMLVVMVSSDFTVHSLSETKSRSSRHVNLSIMIKKMKIWDIITNSSIALIPLLTHDLATLSVTYIFLLTYIFSANAFGIITSDYFDKDFDVLDEHKRNVNLFCSERTWDKVLRRLLIILSFAGSIIIPAFFFQYLLLFNIFVYFPIIFFFGNPRYRLKSKKWIDWGIHALWPISVFTISYMFLHDSVTITYGYLLMLGFLFGLYAQLNNQIRDFDVDRKSWQLNTTIYIGLNRTLKIRRATASLIFVLVGFALILNNALISLTALLGSLFYIRWKGRLSRLSHHGIFWALIFMLERHVLTNLNVF